MTDFLFVRHAEAETNLRPELIGGRSSHVFPTSRGRIQAKRFGLWLNESDIHFDIAYSSPAIRAHETAKIALAAAQYNAAIILDERLHELSHGKFEGLRREKVYTPDIIALYNLSSSTGALPGGESIDDVASRMMNFLIEKHIDHPEGVVLVVSHGLAIRTLAGRLEHMTKQQILDTKTANVSITKISVIDTLPTLHFIGKKVVTE